MAGPWPQHHKSGSGRGSQLVGVGSVSLPFMPLRNAAVVEEEEDGRGRKVCKGGSECVAEAATGPVQGLGSAFPSACAVGQEDEGVVGKHALGVGRRLSCRSAVLFSFHNSASR